MYRTTLLSLVLLISVNSVFAQEADTSAALTGWNDNSLIKVQKKGGDPTHRSDVKLEYYGHDAFKITSPTGLTILVDPWRNDPTKFYGTWFIYKFPALPVDIVLSTHAHFDHDAVELPKGLMVLERLVGDFRLGDVEITGLADKHQCQSPVHHKWDRAIADFQIATCPPNNVPGFDNAIQVIETGGLRIAIWGDNRATPDSSLDRYLKNVDVLILPIDDTGTILTHKEADAIVQKYDPKAVIPAHYLLNGLTTDTSGLKSADEWVNEQKDVRHLDSAELTLNLTELNGVHHRVYYFGENFKKK